MKDFIIVCASALFAFGSMGAYANGNIGGIQFLIQIMLGAILLTVHLKKLDEQND